jgi:DNA polymerase III subunit epsilon
MTSWSDSLAVFDLETTGVDVTTSRIVTAHVGLIDVEGRTVESFDWLADPGVEIPEGASAVHGITTERARAEGRPAAEVVGEVLATLQVYVDAGIPLTVYNAPYDLSLLHHEARRHRLAPLHEPLPVVDPLVIDKALDRYRRGKRTLTVTAEHYGVALDAAHEASSDAIAAGRVAQAIARRFPAELGVSAARLHSMQIAWRAEQAADFQSYMRRVRDPEFVCDTGWPLRD